MGPERTVPGLETLGLPAIAALSAHTCVYPRSIVMVASRKAPIWRVVQSIEAAMAAG